MFNKFNKLIDPVLIIVLVRTRRCKMQKPIKSVEISSALSHLTLSEKSQTVQRTKLKAKKGPIFTKGSQKQL